MIYVHLWPVRFFFSSICKNDQFQVELVTELIKETSVKDWYNPSDPFTTFQHQNPSHNAPKPQIIRGFPVFEALKLRKGGREPVESVPDVFNANVCRKPEADYTISHNFKGHKQLLCSSRLIEKFGLKSTHGYTLSSHPVFSSSISLFFMLKIGQSGLNSQDAIIRRLLYFNSIKNAGQSFHTLYNTRTTGICSGVVLAFSIFMGPRLVWSVFRGSLLGKQTTAATSNWGRRNKPNMKRNFSNFTIPMLA